MLKMKSSLILRKNIDTMLKKIVAFIFVVSSFHCVLAQEIKEIDYVLDGQSTKAYSFSLNRCNMEAINKTWLDWVKSKGGKFSIINNVTGKKEATSVKFKGVSEPYKVFLEVVQTTDSLKIVNAFKDPYGMFLHSQSDSYPTLHEALKDLSFEMRKSCVRMEIEQANSYLAKLNRELVTLQKRKGTLEQRSLKTQNQVLKAETQKNKLSEEISNLNDQIQNADNPIEAEKLSKKLNQSEERFFKVEHRVEKSVLMLNDIQLQAQQAADAIDGTQGKINDQEQLIESLKEISSKIHR